MLDLPEIRVVDAGQPVAWLTFTSPLRRCPFRAPLCFAPDHDICRVRFRNAHDPGGRVYPTHQKIIDALRRFGHLAIITFGLIFEFMCHLPFRVAMRISRTHHH